MGHRNTEPVNLDLLIGCVSNRHAIEDYSPARFGFGRRLPDHRFGVRLAGFHGRLVRPRRRQAVAGIRPHLTRLGYEFWRTWSWPRLPPACEWRAAASRIVGIGGGLSGTDGSRWVRMSTARTGTGFRDRRRPFFFLGDHQNFFQPIQIGRGLHRIFRNDRPPVKPRSPCRPARPLGKIWSPPLVTTLSPGSICSSFMILSRTLSGGGSFQHTL